MPTRDLKSQLNMTLKDADRELKNRIEKADVILSKKTESPSSRKETLSATLIKSNASKVIRDNFTMPEEDYVLIEQIRARFASSGNIMTKSETLRAGLHALASMSDTEMRNVAQKVVRLKPGRAISQSHK